MLRLAVAAAMAALQPPTGAALTRRGAVGAALSIALRPRTARAEGSFGATCLGFGCNAYQNTDYDGMTKSEAPAGSMPYADFLDVVKEKKVTFVEFLPPAGDEAYATMADGARIRVGEGWPMEIGNSWSSPMWVGRILKNAEVPYKFAYDLKMKPTRRATPDWTK